MKNLFAFLCFLLIAPNIANAGLQLTWSQASATATVGQTISVDLILTETVTPNISSFGVSGALFTVTNTPNVGSADLAAQAGTAFDSLLSSASVNSNIATVADGSFLGAGIGSNSVVLGTFTMSSAAIANGSLSAAALNSSNSDIQIYTDAFGNTSISVGNEAFSSGPGSFNYSFTAVPEPTSMITSGVLGLAGAWYARRRKKNAKASAA